jgi:phenylpyruvate tautomerase PptA (4-oxalocrotonate tautomerase family)
MPFYHITHSTPLTPTQRQAFASSLTSLHSTTFTAPSLFVNIKFSPFSNPSNSSSFFVGGKLKEEKTNVVFAYVRGGGTRGKEAFDKLARDIEGLWDSTVGGEETLGGVFVVPGIVARERGFVIPEVISFLGGLDLRDWGQWG